MAREYDFEQASTDFKKLAKSLEAPREDVAATLKTVPQAGHPVRYLRALLRELPDGDRLRDREGDLYSICFGEDEATVDAYALNGLDDDVRSMLEGCPVLGVSGLDAWIDADGSVWRVHPEDSSPRGSVLEFMKKQVSAALEER